MSGIYVGRIGWGLEVNDEGHRTYSLTSLVRTGINNGPLTALSTPGLPATGSFWNYGGELDVWATCYPTSTTRVSRRQTESEPGRLWEVTNKFSTKPLKRCQDESVEDPLLEPQRVGGGFSKQTKQAFFDRNGRAIVSTSFERMFLEVDDNRPNVTIGQNVAALGLETFSEMVDTVNDDNLWGLAKRKIKLSNVSWSREYYGVCSVYYTRRFEFDVNFKTFDEELADKGTMHLKDGGDVLNKDHYVQNIDTFDNTLGGVRLLDVNGHVTDADNVNKITPEYYPESNFLLLGIPTTL